MPSLPDLIDFLLPLVSIAVVVYLWWRASTKPWGPLLVGRLGGYLVDAIAVLLVAGLAWWAVDRLSEGGMSFDLVAIIAFVAYFLFRDVAGASLGKRVLRLRVTGVRPLGSGMVGRILRNVPLALAAAASLPQLEDIDAVTLASQLIVYAEVLALLLTGRRVGDIVAGTTVVRRDVI